MRAGNLDKRIKLQQLAAGQDEIGQPVQTWSDVATVWADIRRTSGLEAVKADSQASIVKASIRIRCRTGIDTGMRVLHGSTVYAINAILPDETGKRHIDLVCEVING